MVILWIAGRQYFFESNGPAIMEIGRGFPEFNQGGGIEGGLGFAVFASADWVLHHVGIERWGVACLAFGFYEDLLAVLGGGAEFAIDQVGAGIGLERLEVGIDGLGVFFRADGKLNIADTGTDRDFRAVADACAHGWRGLMREQEALAVFGIAHAVIEQIPVQAIRTGVGGVATRATLPLLKAERRVMEKHFALADGGEGVGRAQGHGLGLVGERIQIDKTQAV